MRMLNWSVFFFWGGFPEALLGFTYTIIRPADLHSRNSTGTGTLFFQPLRNFSGREQNLNLSWPQKGHPVLPQFRVTSESSRDTLQCWWGEVYGGEMFAFCVSYVIKDSTVMLGNNTVVSQQEGSGFVSSWGQFQPPVPVWLFPLWTDNRPFMLRNAT